eukprot:7994412-Alexandrium_andersonii.AAC.1
MSASLVGSEMCIRDRTRPLKSFRGQSRRYHQRHARCGSELRDSGYVAVSYTHLTLPTICSV